MGKLDEAMRLLEQEKIPDLFLLFIFSLFTCRDLFLPQYSFVAGTDLLNMHLWMEPYLWSKFHSWLFIWSSFMGCGRAIALPTPVFLLGGFLALFAQLLYGGFTTVMTKMLVFLLFPLAGFSMYLFTRRLLKNRVGALISGLFYMYNQWFFSESISEGHYPISLGYAIAPLVFLALENALENSKMKDLLIFSTVLTIFLGSSSHPIYIVGIFSFLYIFFWIFEPKTSRKGRVITAAKVSLISVSLCLFLSVYWIIPEIFCVKEQSVLFSVYHTIDDAYFFSYKSLLDAIAIRNSEINLPNQRIPYWELPLLRELFASGLMFIIPLLAFAAFFIRRDRLTIFCTLSAVISCFLALGPYGLPFSVFIWLWTNVPGYSTFRVGGRFLMMTCFSYAYLIGATIAWICGKLSDHGTYEKWSLRGGAFGHFWERFSKTTVRSLDKIFLASIVVLIICYSWVGCVGGFQVYNLPPECVEPFEWIGQQPGDFRVLAVPYGRVYANYSWSLYGYDLGGSSYGFHNKGIVEGGLDYTSDYEMYLLNVSRLNSTDEIGSMLGIAGVRYIVFMPDASISERSFFSRQRNLFVAYSNGETTVLENTLWSPHFFVPHQSVLVVGGRNSFPSLCEIPGFELNKWALFFAEQPYDEPNVFSVLDRATMIVFSGADLLDLFFTAYPGDVSLRAYEYAFPSSNQSGYWIRSNSWLIEGELVLCRSTLRTSAESSVDIPFTVSSHGVYDVWLRVAFAEDRGRLTMRIDNETVLDGYKPYALSRGFGWVPLEGVFLSAGRHTLTLINDGSGLNDVDKIVVYPSSAFEEDLNRFVGMLQTSNSRMAWVIEAEDMLSEDMLLGNETLLWWWGSSSWGCYASNGWTLKSASPTEVSVEELIPRGGRYALALKVVTGPQYGDLILQIDDQYEFIVPCSGENEEVVWREISPFYLSAGNHTLRLVNKEWKTLEVDELVLYSLFDYEESLPLDQLFSSSKSVDVSYEEVNPTEYVVHVKADAPFILCFSESYHSLWKAYVRGREIPSTIVYSFLNGFYVEEIGEFDIVVKFGGQRYAEIGMAISMSTLIAIVVYLVYSWKGKEKWHKPFSLLKRITRTFSFGFAPRR